MTPARIVVGEFGPIGAVGLGIMLDAEGLEFETTGVAERELLATVADEETEVVVLDREMPQALRAAAQVAAERPDVRVILCSLDDTTMSVYPEHGGAPYEAPLDAPRLAAAIRERR